MKVEKTERGFEWISNRKYTDQSEEIRLVSQSSAIGDDCLDKPGSSYLWIGDAGNHLDRTQVAELVQHLQAWLKTGSLVVKE